MDREQKTERKRPHTDTTVPYIQADPQDIVAALLRTLRPRSDLGETKMDAEQRKAVKSNDA